MSLLNHLFGNASEVNINELKNEFGDILIPEEEIVAAFRIFRDKWVFTNKRLIMLDVQGVTGKQARLSLRALPLDRPFQRRDLGHI